jgi:DNA-directed RNA polymerase specialized sigma24 family protein
MTDGEIYEELRWELMRFATALFGPDQAGDAVSTVVCRVLARPGGLTGLDDPKPYLVRRIQNEACSRNRTERRRLALPIGVGSASAVDLGHDHLLELVMSLPVRQRAALYLTAHEGYSRPSETAALLGCRPATVHRCLHIARGKLREALDG